MLKRARLVYVFGSILITIITLLTVYSSLVSIGAVQTKTNDLVLTSKSISKVYDGTPLVVSNDEKNYVEITGGELFSGHTIEYTYLGAQTEAGKSDNLFIAKIYDTNKADVTDRYNISYEYGSIEVNKREIVINADNIEKEYDGTSLEIDDDAYYIQSGILADLNHKFKAKLKGSQTEVGSIQADVMEWNVIDGNDNDISHNYFVSFSKNTGIITVNKRTIKIISESISKVYDGKELKSENDTNTISILSGKLLEGDYLVPTYKTSITNVSEPVKNEYYITAFDKYGNDVTNHYDFKQEYGTLEIKKFKLNITTESERFVYDGKEHFPSSDDNDYSFDLLPDNFTASYTVSLEKKAVSVGSYKKNIELTIKDQNGKETDEYGFCYADNFEADTKNELVICKAEIKINDLDVNSYYYNGKEQLYSSINYDLIFNNNTIEKYNEFDINVLITSSGIDSGNYKKNYSIEVIDSLGLDKDEDGNSYIDNFDFSYYNDIFTISKKDLYITLKEEHKTYNSEYQSYTASGIAAIDKIYDKDDKEVDIDIIESIEFGNTSFKNAGTYSIALKSYVLKENASNNYNIFCKNGSYFTISPKPISVSVDDDETDYNSEMQTYKNLNLQALTANNVLEDFKNEIYAGDDVDVSIKIAEDQLLQMAKYNAGEYEFIVNCTLAGQSKDNYVLLDDKPKGKFTITKKKAYITLKNDTNSYDGEKHSYDLTQEEMISDNSLNDIFEKDREYISIQVNSDSEYVNAGTYKIEYDFSFNNNDIKDNYEIVPNDLYLLITKKKVNVSLKQKVIEYDGQPHKYVIENGEDPIDYVYLNAQLVDADKGNITIQNVNLIGNSTEKNVGYYSIDFTFDVLGDGKDNYEFNKINTNNIKINPKILYLSTKDHVTTYKSEEITYNGVDLSSKEFNEDNFIENDYKNKVYNDDISIKITIDQAELEKMTQTNAGTHTFKINCEIEGSDKDNYVLFDDKPECNFIINKKIAYVSIENANHVYDGKEHSYDLSQDEIKISSNDIYETDSALFKLITVNVDKTVTAKNVGSVKVEYDLNDVPKELSDNYVLEKSPAYIIIIKKKINVSLKKQEYVYDGQPHEYVIENGKDPIDYVYLNSQLIGDDKGNITIQNVNLNSNSTGKNVGYYSIDFTFDVLGDGKDNYEFISYYKNNVVITKKEVTITYKDYNTTYDGKEKIYDLAVNDDYKPTITGMAPSDAEELQSLKNSLNITKAKGTNAGEYENNVSIENEKNFINYDFEIIPGKLIINQLEVYVSGAKEVTYTGNKYVFTAADVANLTVKKLSNELITDVSIKSCNFNSVSCINVGVYPIPLSNITIIDLNGDDVSNNYKIKMESSYYQLTIQKKLINVTIESSYSQTYSGEKLTISSYSLNNDLSVTGLAGNQTILCNNFRTSSSEVGDYSIELKNAIESGDLIQVAGENDGVDYSTNYDWKYYGEIPENTVEITSPKIIEINDNPNIYIDPSDFDEDPYYIISEVVYDVDEAKYPNLGCTGIIIVYFKIAKDDNGNYVSELYGTPDVYLENSNGDDVSNQYEINYNGTPTISEDPTLV
ncbi:MAG: hypothetical protein MR357_00400 [Anaeroplasma sp.]|nr:hypothetical protein [Anaeroplasma sp.]